MKWYVKCQLCAEQLHRDLFHVGQSCPTRLEFIKVQTTSKKIIQTHPQNSTQLTAFGSLCLIWGGRAPRADRQADSAVFRQSQLPRGTVTWKCFMYGNADSSFPAAPFCTLGSLQPCRGEKKTTISGGSLRYLLCIFNKILSNKYKLI